MVGFFAALLSVTQLMGRLRLRQLRLARLLSLPRLSRLPPLLIWSLLWLSVPNNALANTLPDRVQVKINDIENALSFREESDLARIIQKIIGFHGLHARYEREVVFPLRVLSVADYEIFADKHPFRLDKNTLGYYIPMNNELIVKKTPNYAQTIIHEAQHLIYEHYTNNAPLSLNEGLSEFFELAEVSNASVVVYVSDSKLAILREWARRDKSMVDMATYLRIPDQQWALLDQQSGYQLRYISWGIVHTMMGSEGGRQALAKTLHSVTNTGMDIVDALDLHYGLARLQIDFERLLASGWPSRILL
ncbi:hypothetical protein [Ostreibacterium oceani]|uniref:Peptidase MA superfamily protein n=1 Tax=Ostreibacterium oceani TaxID=2654998 RepID=A0A6N7ESX5_9GAMM|nr:hypothetical protein [Ostreibacterium oceani]MPV85602.1 hypothetical protein [Ostreibacterium oceani]